MKHGSSEGSLEKLTFSPSDNPPIAMSKLASNEQSSVSNAHFPESMSKPGGLHEHQDCTPPGLVESCRLVESVVTEHIDINQDPGRSEGGESEDGRVEEPTLTQLQEDKARARIVSLPPTVSDQGGGVAELAGDVLASNSASNAVPGVSDNELIRAPIAHACDKHRDAAPAATGLMERPVLRMGGHVDNGHMEANLNPGRSELEDCESVDRQAEGQAKKESRIARIRSRIAPPIGWNEGVGNEGRAVGELGGNEVASFVDSCTRQVREYPKPISTLRA